MRFYPLAWFGVAAAAFVGWAFVALASAPTPKPHVRVESPVGVGCKEIVVATEYACPDGHVYIVSRSGWQDIGPITPIPQVPRG